MKAFIDDALIEMYLHNLNLYCSPLSTSCPASSLPSSLS